MKINQQDRKEFRPFLLEIEIESLDELKELWNVLNQSNNDIIKSSKIYAKYPLEEISENIYDFWNIIDNKLKEIL